MSAIPGDQERTSFDRSLSVRVQSPEKKPVVAFFLRVWPLWGKLLAHRDPRARDLEKGLHDWQSGDVWRPWM